MSDVEDFSNCGLKKNNDNNVVIMFEKKKKKKKKKKEKNRKITCNLNTIFRIC